MAGRGRLSLSTALSRNNTLDSSCISTQSNASSASVAYAEREVKKLKEENGKLRKEIKEVRSLYNQLVQENSHEKFDERRIMLIKSQVIQLERQLLMMSEAISSRSETLTEVENALTWLADQWRQYIAEDTRGPEVSVRRADLTLMVETAESARIKLYKNLENMSHRNFSRPLMFMNEFVKPGYEGEITMLDIASGQLEHLNLKHVAKLETKLATLYKELISFHSLIEESKSPSLHPVSQHANKALQDRTITKLLKSCAMIKDCCGDLVQLSLLYPSAPWPPLKRSAVKDLNCENVMKSLPSLPKNKTKEVESVLEALLKAVNYKYSMMTHEIKSLREDLKFHQSVYDLQLEYIGNLFDAVKDGYKKFEDSTKDVILQPLQDILLTYGELKDSASEKALKEFLSCFKLNAEKLENAVDQLSVGEEETGSDALSQFGEDFFYSLDKMVSKCQRNRDKAVKQRADLKQVQEKLEEELRNLLDEQELKYKEHFIDTSRTENKEDVLNVIPSQKENANIVGKEGIVVKTDCPSIELDVHTESLESSSADNLSKKNTSKQSSKSLKKWNDDTSCPPTFDGMDFIYKSKEETKTITEGEGEDMEGVLMGIRALSCSPLQTERLEEINSLNVLPPVGKQMKKTTKPKRNYTPNLVVANRTLQLRRSNSSSKINESQEKNDRISHETENCDDSDEKVNKALRSRSRSQERKQNVPHKPPFR